MILKNNYNNSILFLIFLFLFKVSHAFSNEAECKIKLIPKLDAFIIVTGSSKTEWVKIESISKLSECVKNAENILQKANSPKEIKSIKDFVGAIVLAPFEPEYYKAIKLIYRDEFNKKIKLKIRYKKK